MWLGIASLYRAKLLLKKRTPLQTIYVYAKGPIRFMRFTSEGWQGALDTRNKQRILFPYQRFFLAFRAWLPEIRTFLALGVGTGTALRAIRQHFPSARMTGVDLDASVLQVAVEYFECPSDELTQLVAMHGRAFLESTDEKYDLIFLDTYDSYSIPYSMRTVESFTAMRNVLNEQGLLIANVIGALEGPNSHSFRSIYKTIRQVFPKIWVLPVSRRKLSEQNVIIIAGNKTADLRGFTQQDTDLQKLLRNLYQAPIPTDDVFAYEDHDSFAGISD